VNLQSFEMSFFNLLRLNIDITVAAAAEVNGLGYIGQNCFLQLNGKLASDVRQYPNVGGMSLDVKPQIILIVLKQIYRTYYNVLITHFRNVYNIINFVSTSDIEDKRKYMMIVMDQLTPSELALIFYTGVLTDMENEPIAALKRLIEEYALFSHFPLSALISPGHKSLYSDSAYMNASNNVPIG